MRKEARYGKSKSYRKRVKGPDGKYHDVYGRTIAERDLAVAELRASWAAEEKIAADPFVWQYAAAWFARRKPGLSEQMCEHYSQQINTIILPVIGSLRMSEVTTDSIADVMATRAHLGRSSQRDTVQTLKQIFSAAADADVIRKDPTRTLKPGGKKPPQKKALTKRQEEELLSAVAGLRAEGFVRLGLFAGLRREEICGLLWDCVFESDTTPHIIVCRACRWPQHSQPEISNQLKSDAAARSIPIPPQLSEWLAAERARQQKSRSGDLSAFPVVGREDGRPITYSSLQSLLRSVAVRCAAPDRPLGSASPKHPAVRVTVSTKVTAHFLRHTYITRLILGGVPLKRVQYLAGHADPTITIKIYTDLMGHAPEDLADDINAVFAPVQTPPATPPTPPETP